MSRIGKLPVAIPQGVKIVHADALVRAEGPQGKLELKIPARISIEVAGGQIRVGRENDERDLRAIHGLTRKLIANMVAGVSQGFTRVLEINGVGYRAEARGSALHLTLGYSHPIVFPLPQGVTASVERQTVVTLRAADKQLLGQVAAMVRRLRGPEPYQGKGIKYQQEVIRRKAGKAVGGSSAK